jgi:hypothetical protein
MQEETEKMLLLSIRITHDEEAKMKLLTGAAITLLLASQAVFAQDMPQPSEEDIRKGQEYQQSLPKPPMPPGFEDLANNPDAINLVNQLKQVQVLIAGCLQMPEPQRKSCLDEKMAQQKELATKLKDIQDSQRR